MQRRRSASESSRVPLEVRTRAGRGRGDGAEFGDRDLEVGEDFEQECLELLVGAVDLVDQQDRRIHAADGGEERAFEQVALREDVLFDFAAASPPSRALMARSWRW
jgi:hypothetical protein